MKSRKLFILFFVAILAISCSNSNTYTNPIVHVLDSEHPKIKAVMSNLEAHEIQILFTEIHRFNKDSVTFIDHQFQVDSNNYFYPASSVKFPVALLALEKLNEQNYYNRDTPYYMEGDTLISTFSNDIEKIFAVSDNEAYNRLYEYLGKNSINNRLETKNLTARISHRLSTPNSGRLSTKSLVFIINDSTQHKTDTIKNSAIEALQLNMLLKGKGYMDDGVLINRQKDFSDKNYFPISSLHGAMKRLMFPLKFPKNERFNLLESDRDFIINKMKILPRDANFDSKKYYDSYGKFLIYGDSKAPISNEVEIYNKVGYAYGYLTDCAYIKNHKTNKEYIITATIHVNENEIFNDDNYEYESVGIPFLAELGRQLIE